MRVLIWVVALFALAVGVTLAVRYNAGYALLVWPPYRIELTLNMLVLILVATFAAGHWLVRLISAAVRLPAAVKASRERRRRERARTALIDALRAFFEGRFGRARKAAAIALEQGESPALSAVLAARAAHELRDWDARDALLARAGNDASEATLCVVARADMLLDQRRYQEALAALNALEHKHTAALRLELKAQQLARNWEQVLALTAQLEKRSVFDAAQAQRLRRAAHVENLKRKALDRRAFEEYWERLPTADKRDSKIAAVAAQCFVTLGGCGQAHAVAEASLESQWDSELIGLYADCRGADTLAQIERAERWLADHPRDAMLLLTLGRLCAHQQLWGKAQNYLEASVAVEPTHTAHLALAQLHERLGSVDAAQRHYRASLDLALTQLKDSSGGRRKTPA